MILYLTGIDGSGKSTIAKRIEKEIFHNKKVVSIWSRYQPKFVKLLLAPFKKKYTSNSSEPHLMDKENFSKWVILKKKLTKNIFLSKLLFTIQSIDYYLQLNHVKKEIKNHKDKVVIIDRYYLDFIVDQSINYGDISNWFFTKFFLKKLEKLTLVLYLDVDEETAMRRKDDIPSMEYFTNRKYYYTKYLSKIDNAYIVNNVREIEETIDEIKQIIIDNKT